MTSLIESTAWPAGSNGRWNIRNSNAKFARCGEFAVSRLPATILRDEHINPVMQQQRASAAWSNGPRA